MHYIYLKVKQSHYRRGQPWGFQEVEAPRFQDNRHMKGSRLSALRTGRLCPQETFLVLISVKGWGDPRVIVRLEGLCQWKNPMTPSGIESVTFRFVAHYLNRLHHRVPTSFTHSNIPRIGPWRTIRNRDLTMSITELYRVQFPYLESCGVRNWRNTKKKEKQGVRVVPVLWHEMSSKNTGPSYIGR